jgi:glycosyltransferase involved in cell wall biosynthesis
MSKSPLVSIIVPVYNRPDLIKKLLISISRQTYKKIETIVVDDSSTDNTAEVARRFFADVYTRKHAERSVQRNFGATKSKGKFILFLDSDMELTKSVISECVYEMENNTKTGGIVIPEESTSNSFWEKVKSFERSFYNSNDGDSVTDAARFFRKEAFDKVGGYDTAITGPEDWDLSESVKGSGYKISRIKSVIIHHETIPNLYSLVKKKYFYAFNSHSYLKKQKVSVFSSKTIYFLRPVFYKNWRKLVSNPGLSIAMFVMFSIEMVAGAIGFLAGKFKYN